MRVRAARMHRLSNILTSDELAAVNSVLAAAPFEDGRLTAGAAAQRRKHNLQLSRSQATDVDELRAMDELIIAALSRHPVFNSIVQPRRVLAPTYGRYEPGMHYGMHVDNPIMGGAEPMRTDVSVTLFLSDPSNYDGGELTVESPGGARQFKLPAGDAIVYPTTALHRVEPVSRGVRMVAVTWAQSFVRDGEFRQILHDLSAVLASLGAAQPDSLEATLIAKCHANLLRKVMEP
jgi:PKHD-type hydroxylase